MEPFELQVAKDEVDVSVHELNQKRCGRTLYNLVSYKMIERTVGWSWMKGDTGEKECCQCHKKEEVVRPKSNVLLPGLPRPWNLQWLLVDPITE
jgi:hypothetical protein